MWRTSGYYEDLFICVGLKTYYYEDFTDKRRHLVADAVRL
jgi:hypothetical protein